MTIYASVSELIGNTPLVELTNYEKNHGLKARIVGKVESFNPAGSIKDRIAKAMIDDALERGVIDGDTVLIEPRATPASAWRLSPPRAACASSLPCPKRCPSSAATS